MTYRPNDAYHCQFTTQSPGTGAAADTDAPAIAKASRNGVDDVTFPLTINNIEIGRHRITGTIPATYLPGDVVQISVTATVSTISAIAIVDSFVIDSKRNNDLKDFDVLTQAVDVKKWNGVMVTISPTSNLPAVDTAAINDNTLAASTLKTNVNNLTNLDTTVSSRSTFNATTTSVITGSFATGALVEFITTNTGLTFNNAIPGSIVWEIVSNAIGNNKDWTDNEKQNIRHRLGIDGIKTLPTSSGDLSDIKDIMQAATLK